MSEHRIVLGCPFRRSLGWYWWTPSPETLVPGQTALWVVRKPLVARDGAAPEPQPQAPRPTMPPLVVQLDHLSEQGWEVLVPLSVAERDEQGHAQVGVIMHRSAAGDRARVKGHV